MTLDLNLLLVFDAVMTERNLRRAGEQLGRTQPAISQSVARLRDVFADRLFVKTPAGVTPTPRAEALWRELAEPIARVRAVASRATFDPRAVSGDLFVGFSDDLELIAFADVMQALRSAAPNARLKAVEVDHASAPAALDEGRIDVALTVAEPARGIGREELFRQPFVILHRKDDPAPATIAKYCTRVHVAVGFSGGTIGYTDRWLEAQERARTIVATTPRFAALPQIVAATDAIATLPGPVARLFARLHGLCVSPVPFALPAVPVCLLWHERRRHDPMNVWLRGLVRDATAAARAKLERR